MNLATFDVTLPSWLAMGLAFLAGYGARVSQAQAVAWWRHRGER